MKHVLQITATLLLAVIVLPSFAADAKDEKAADVNKADPAKKDDKDPKADPAKKDDKDAKADPAKKDAKLDAAKKDDKDAKPDAAKKDAKANDPAKKDDKKSDTKKADKKDEHVNTEKSLKAGTVTGKIVTVEGTKRTLRLSVPFSVPKLDQGAVSAVAAYKLSATQLAVQAQQASTQANQYMAQAQQALSKKDKNGYQTNLNQAQQYQQQAASYQLQATQQTAFATRQSANLYRNETKYQEIEVSTTEDVKVRTANPPEAFDDKGKARRLTSKELKEARGSDTKLPGYQADFSNLREEQTITATLIKNKDKELPKVKPSYKKDKDADLLGDNLPQATLIVIVAEPPASK